MSPEDPRRELAALFPFATRFGLLAGLLAVASPYFLGLATAVAAVATVAWVPRWSTAFRPLPRSSRRLPFIAGALASGVALLWIVGSGAASLPWPARPASLTAMIGLIALAPATNRPRGSSGR